MTIEEDLYRELHLAELEIHAAESGRTDLVRSVPGDVCLACGGRTNNTDGVLRGMVDPECTCDPGEEGTGHTYDED